MICDECETVAHCTKYGCIPKHQALETALAEQPAQQGQLSFNCSAGCGACSVKLQDFVTHQTQAKEGDQWVVVDSVPQIVSTCCGSPVEVWDERKQDTTARVEAAPQPPAQQECRCNQWQVCHVCDPILPAQRNPLTDEQFLELLLRTGSTELVTWATFVGESIQMRGRIGLLRCAKLFKEFVEAAHGIKENT
jgi:hypothetical protein